ncbi:hemoglobin [Pseudomonas linyingensis]|jgi:hemoglobin|uniref:Hemoglobin n=1 Tax=Pseudomonas linyingensis TaxID=915471 RepID=A0A1H6XC09_9PSED|nr:group II truncated hemoglobin [Pseudomonas linyingensis]MCM2319665.1 group II truncated hemoglobin [Pseudomonas sp.]SEJ25666.1 hemoglobin [Pseudomonas linyingensis]
MNNTPYQLLGGEDGVRRLCEAFYDCMEQLPEAADIRRMHGEDLSGIRQKLFEFLSGWLGGPHLYAQKYGSICMTGPHRPFAIGPKERDQWLLCMDRALEQVGASEEVKTMLKQPLQAIADMIRNRETSASA